LPIEILNLKYKLKDNLKYFGFIFENLVLKDLSAYAELIDGKIYYYRDNTDLEIDAIIKYHGSFGAIAIKLGSSDVEKGIKNLQRFKSKCTTAPKFLVIIVGIGENYRITSDGIIIIPFDCLGFK
jgi:predicted AAA+ superfamily ATPase